MNPYEIKELSPTGVLAEMGVEQGDLLLSINGRSVVDELDIRFLGGEEEILVEVQKPDGEIWELEIEKESDEPLGLHCDGGTLGIRRCRNNCVFCFIDQMPPGMRDTLYIKDDDERLSFLQGNYVTLTNLSEALKRRIVDYHIMPINISIHTTDPELRCKMLGNRFAGSILEDLAFFSEHHIQMNGQIVMCPGYNDGEALKKTLEDVMAFYPWLQSLSVVPVGLSSYREGLPALYPVDAQKAAETLDIIREAQDKMLAQYGVRFVFPSDEFFLLAGQDLPGEDYYGDFSQLENGVGMMTDFKAGLRDALAGRTPESKGSHRFGIITGVLAKGFMEACAGAIEKVYPGADIGVLPIKNNHFGPSITVSGLVTGGDIVAQIPKENEIETYFIPENMVRYGTEDFLDDMTLGALSQALGAEVAIVPVRGDALAEAVAQRLIGG
ncbi:DUF512 domain-containing protein [Eubacterium sp.]|uniref:DUF512 domain-containing protein n=1 Tax=Eubacterium sp. TaxID=142586 RepID=UPI002FC61EB5